MYQFEMGGVAVKCDTADELRSALNGNVHIAEAGSRLNERKPKAKRARATADKSGNKSKAIREYHEANPTAKPAEIATALSQQGLYVSAQFASTVLSNAKRKAKAK